MYKSRIVDVGALVAAGVRDAAVRTRLEAALEQARGALRAARQTAASIQQAERGATTQLCDVSASLAAARARIASLTVSIEQSKNRMPAAFMHTRKVECGASTQSYAKACPPATLRRSLKPSVSFFDEALRGRSYKVRLFLKIFL